MIAEPRALLHDRATIDNIIYLQLVTLQPEDQFIVVQLLIEIL
jgi:hypothetical protein